MNIVSPLNISPVVISVEVLQKIRNQREREREGEREMTTIRKFCCNDLLRFSSVQLDYFTITREMPVYLKWLINWSNYCHFAAAPGNRIMGYILGAHKEDIEEIRHWRGLVMAVSVASQYRRQKVATELMRFFEKQMVQKMLVSPSNDHYYMFIYVGVFHTPAQRLFKKMGFIVIKTIKDFFSKNDEDAYEMIKEILEERQSCGGVQMVELCRFCIEAKRENCSYVCLPYIG